MKRAACLRIDCRDEEAEERRYCQGRVAPEGLGGRCNHESLEVASAVAGSYGTFPVNGNEVGGKLLKLLCGSGGWSRPQHSGPVWGHEHWVLFHGLLLSLHMKQEGGQLWKGDRVPSASGIQY